MSAHKHEIAISNLDLGLIFAFIIAKIWLGICDAHTALYECLKSPSMRGRLVQPKSRTNSRAASATRLRVATQRDRCASDPY